MDDDNRRYLQITFADDRVRASNPRHTMKLATLTSNGNLNQRHKGEGDDCWKIHFAVCSRPRGKIDVGRCLMGRLMERVLS